MLAIDPGYDRLGVAVLAGTGSAPRLLFSTCITTDATLPLPDRLAVAGKILDELLSEHRPDAVALETLFFNKNVKTGIAVAEARGIAVYLAKCAGATVLEFSPQEVKVAVTGYGQSDKTAVIEMVKRLVPGVPEKAWDDEYDAIAVGVTALSHHRG